MVIGTGSTDRHGEDHGNKNRRYRPSWWGVMVTVMGERYRSSWCGVMVTGTEGTDCYNGESW